MVEPAPQPDGGVNEINRWLEDQPYKLAVVSMD